MSPSVVIHRISAATPNSRKLQHLRGNSLLSPGLTPNSRKKNAPKPLQSACNRYFWGVSQPIFIQIRKNRPEPDSCEGTTHRHFRCPSETILGSLYLRNRYSADVKHQSRKSATILTSIRTAMGFIKCDNGVTHINSSLLSVVLHE